MCSSGKDPLFEKLESCCQLKRTVLGQLYSQRLYNKSQADVYLSTYHSLFDEFIDFYISNGGAPTI